MRSKKTLSSIFVLLVFSFLFWKIFSDFDQVKNVNWQLSKKNSVLLLIVLLAGPFVNALSWHLYTKALGGGINLIDNMLNAHIDKVII